jgi:[acyl-carrier-protein] S-malonyltransferase
MTAWRMAFLFTGQGAQFPGMGREIAEVSAAAREVFACADETLGLPLSRLCFEGPEEDLRRTEQTQPALLAVSMALLAAARERGLPDPAFVAGHSLGEYTAACAAGSLDLPAALRLVQLRGRLMQEAVPEGRGAMAAILWLAPERVAEICAECPGVVVPANYNEPNQTVISGEAAAVGEACRRLKEAGARRTLSLPVSAPFHSPLLEPMMKPFTAALDAVTWRDPAMPLCANADAALKRTAAEVRACLEAQILRPVRWSEVLQCLEQEGVTAFVEFGPKGVLAGLVRRCRVEGAAYAIHDAVSLDETLDQLLVV